MILSLNGTANLASRINLYDQVRYNIKVVTQPTLRLNIAVFLQVYRGGANYLWMNAEHKGSHLVSVHYEWKQMSFQSSFSCFSQQTLKHQPQNESIQQQYHLLWFKEEMTWRSAFHHCRSRILSLPILHNHDKLRSITEFLLNNILFLGHIFLGLVGFVSII